MVIFNGLRLFFILGIHSILAKNLSKKITIMYSHRAPFVIKNHDDGLPKGLDVSIMEHFARKMALKIEYIQSNESLHSVFHKGKNFTNFLEHPNFE